MNLSKVSQQFFSKFGDFFTKPNTQDAFPPHILQNMIFAKDPALPKKNPSWISAKVTNSISLISSYTSIYRSVHDLLISYLSYVPHSQLSWLHHFCSTKDMALGYHAFGTATGINMITGIAHMREHFDNFSFANAIGDTRGSLLGKVSFAESAALFGSGVSFAGFRPLGIFTSIKNISHSTFEVPTLIGRITHGFLFMGMIFYTFLFSLATVVFGIKIHEGINFKNTMKEAQGLSEKLESLQKKQKVDPDKILEKLHKKHGGSKELVEKQLISEAFSSGTKGLKDLLKELGLEKVSNEKLKNVVNQIISKTDGEAKQSEEYLMQIGLQMRARRAQLKKEAKLDRILGKGLQELKSVSSLDALLGRIRKGEKGAIAQGEALLEKIEAASRNRLNKNIFMLVMMIIAVVGIVASIILSTGGIGILAAAILLLVFSVVMMGVDGYDLLQSYKEERPAKYDKKLLLFTCVVGICSLMTVTLLASLGVVTMGIFPMILSGILASAWLGQCGVTWAVMSRNERLYKLKNPTLETFFEALKSGKEKEMIIKMMQNLPEAIREQIQNELKNHENDMKSATRAVIEKVERAKKEQFEHLRKSLTTYIIQ